MTAYAIDKIDMLGVVAEEKHNYVMNQLEQMMDASVSNAEDLVGSIVF